MSHGVLLPGPFVGRKNRVKIRENSKKQMWLQENFAKMSMKDNLESKTNKNAGKLLENARTLCNTQDSVEEKMGMEET